jgi:hypothetical protein
LLRGQSDLQQVATTASGGEAYFALRWNGGFGTDSSPSGGDPCRRTLRPFATSRLGHPPLPFDDSGLTFDPRRLLRISLKFGVVGLSSAGGRIDPIDGLLLVARTRFAARAARDERGDDIVRSNAFALALDRLEAPVEGDDLGLDANLLSKFTGDRERRPHARLNVYRP